LLCKFSKNCGGGATQPFPRNVGVEELHGDPSVGPRSKVWTRGQKMEGVVPKMARRRGSDAGQPGRR